MRVLILVGDEGELGLMSCLSGYQLRRSSGDKSISFRPGFDALECMSVEFPMEPFDWKSIPSLTG